LIIEIKHLIKCKIVSFGRHVDKKICVSYKGKQSDYNTQARGKL